MNVYSPVFTQRQKAYWVAGTPLLVVVALLVALAGVGRAVVVRVWRKSNAPAIDASLLNGRKL